MLIKYQRLEERLEAGDSGPQETGVQPMPLFRPNLLVIFAYGNVASPTAHFLSALGIGDKFFEGVRKGIGIPRWNEHSCFAIPNDDATPFVVSRDDRQTTGRRFNQEARHSLVVFRREGCRVSLIH